MTQKKKNPDNSDPGPEPERLKIEGNWEAAAGKAIKKKRPEGGWPKPEPKKKAPEPPLEEPEAEGGG